MNNKYHTHEHVDDSKENISLDTFDPSLDISKHTSKLICISTHITET